jgi:hypothetical protein
LVPVSDARREEWQQGFREMYYSTQETVDALLQEMLKEVVGAGGETGIYTQAIQRRAVLDSLRIWAEHLKRFGSALAAALPSRFGCNWPGCVRLSGASEGYGLVRGQACVCGGCRQAR